MHVVENEVRDMTDKENAKTVKKHDRAVDRNLVARQTGLDQRRVLNASHRLQNTQEHTFNH